MNCSLLPQNIELSNLICNYITIKKQHSALYNTRYTYQDNTYQYTFLITFSKYLLKEDEVAFEKRGKQKDTVIILSTLKNRIDLRWSIVQRALRHFQILAWTREQLPVPHSFSLDTEWLRFDLFGSYFLSISEPPGCKTNTTHLKSDPSA